MEPALRKHMRISGSRAADQSDKVAPATLPGQQPGEANDHQPEQPEPAGTRHPASPHFPRVIRRGDFGHLHHGGPSVEDIKSSGPESLFRIFPIPRNLSSRTRGRHAGPKPFGIDRNSLFCLIHARADRVATRGQWNRLRIEMPDIGIRTWHALQFLPIRTFLRDAPARVLAAAQPPSHSEPLAADRWPITSMPAGTPSSSPC